jgi:hypothetical protein
VLQEAVREIARKGGSQPDEYTVDALGVVALRLVIGKQPGSDEAFNEAVSAAQHVRDLEKRSRALARVAVHLAAAGRDATPLFQESLACSNDVLGGNRNSLLAFIAQSMASALADNRQQNVREALAVAESISSPQSQSHATGMVAVSQAARGDLDGALATIARASCDYGIRFNELAEAMIRRGGRPAFLRLLVPAAYHRDAAVRMCCHLVELFPEAALEIASVVLAALPEAVDKEEARTVSRGDGPKTPAVVGKPRTAIARVLRWFRPG